MKSKVERAKEQALERFDYLLRVYEAPDFVEITGSIGGDVETYRYYSDGNVYAK